MSEHFHVKTSGSRDSLRDLGRVGLEIEPLASVMEDEGLSRQELFSLTRERLGRAPVQVLSRTGALHLTGAPTLFLDASISECGSGSYLCIVALELVQGVSLERLSNSDRLFAVPTWRAQASGLIHRRQLSSLKDWIRAIADAFAKDSSAERCPADL